MESTALQPPIPNDQLVRQQLLEIKILNPIALIEFLTNLKLQNPQLSAELLRLLLNTPNQQLSLDPKRVALVLAKLREGPNLSHL